MKYEHLSKINSPSDLKNFPEKEIPGLCSEIRDFLVESVEKNGGHLASNLGVTELTVAIHRVFDSPRDHIIFDVGHQSYVHKILTGRRDDFGTLRRVGGLSGFTKMSESEHDAFGAGHSSTSISAALGYARADKLKGNSAYTVAVIGDGSYTGGMVHEALNNCDPDLPLVIILNENGMSISLNKGTFATYLSKIRVSRGYINWKQGTISFLDKLPLIGSPIRRFMTYVRTKIKNLLYSSNYFEDLGLYYMGPFDGNDYKKVETALKKAKRLGKCVVVHVKTLKGKGYDPAELSPDKFHGVACQKNEGSDFHTECVNGLISYAEKDESIVSVTAAMGIGTGLDSFGKKYPERYFDVGIAEGHALTFSAGLAAAGLKPFVAIYSTFLQRGYDSILHDIALQDLPVKMLIDRAGLSHGDGATHHGIFDVAFLSHIPRVEIFSPITYRALDEALEYAVSCEHPVAIRYPNAQESARVARTFYNGSCTEKWFKTDFDSAEPREKVFITYGGIVSEVLMAKDLCKANCGEDVGVILLERLKPCSDIAKFILPYINNARHVVFVEEGIKMGGAAMLLREELLHLGFDFSKCRYDIAAIDDNFAAPDKACDLLDYVGLSAEKLAQKFSISE